MDSSIGGSRHGGKRSGSGRPTIQQEKIRKTENQAAGSRTQWTAYEAGQHLIGLRSELLNRKGGSYSIEENKIALLFVLDLNLVDKR
ncbi:unnamed protein product [Rotaria sp. Silwood2]|nr:unnamed protein product [Rotaria sp. Silwood2]CAF2836207.1 unnamed protein product [Rotaria sp. Silwood2]CAF3205251.1 unnamed protein product [Rotaria sp. Silwood2]CAF4101267.1 unnamed protein product [Rotaria sp. Silwood2]CAF4229609.1 unnamed protein product [Rotaria sp. Silwood2]